VTRAPERPRPSGGACSLARFPTADLVPIVQAMLPSATVRARPTDLGEVMVVEDDHAIRETLAEVLEEEGLEVTWATNGAEALRLLRAAPAPRLILLDLMMPVMDGWELRKALQEDPALARIPVVIISADNALPQKASALAVDGYLAKPFRLDALLSTVHRYC
jgi:CheY-like chemotaxis protein